MKKIITSLTLFSFLMGFSNTDKYRIILTSNPSSSITIGWNQISGSSPKVYYGTTDFGINHSKYPHSKEVDRSVDFRGMKNKFVRLTNLKPNTIYYFVINDSQGNSARFWFKTAPDDLSRLSFIAGGDSRNNRGPRRKANLLVSKLKPNAVFFGGDMTVNDNESQWKEWFDDWQLTIAPDGRMFPIIPARGNHENRFTIHNLFDTPNKKSYYAITFGDNLIRTYTLNTSISVSGKQKIWLEKDLENHNKAIFKMAQYHKPMRPHTKYKSEGDTQYNAWAKLFYQKGVRLVIDSDSHMVKTTWPIQPSSEKGNDEGFIRNDKYGTVYAGEGCWGAPLRRNDDDKKWTRDSGSFNQFKLIFVSKDNIELRTIKVDNAYQVSQGLNENPFVLPKNLEVWNPSQGAVVNIKPIKSVEKPVIKFAQGKTLNLSNGDNTSVDLKATENADKIKKVKFYVNGNFVSDDDSAPYNFVYSYTSGSNRVKAVAETKTDMETETEIFVNVGNFSVNNAKLKIDNGDNDVEETESGVIYFGSTDIEIGYDKYKFVSGTPNGFQKIGLRFEGLNIPKGAIINNAYIQFRTDEVKTKDAEFNIYVENSGDAHPFENNTKNNVSSRSKYNEFVYWEPAPWNKIGEAGAAQQTPDLKELLQKIVNHNGWSQENSTVFIIEPTGRSLTDKDAKRVADSREGSSSHPPTLVYSYSFKYSSVSPSLSVHKQLKGKTFTLYPNPYNDKFYISIPKLSFDKVLLEITDIKGHLVYMQRLTTGKGHYIICNWLRSGIYMVRLYSKRYNYNITKKLLKK